MREEIIERVYADKNCAVTGEGLNEANFNTPSGSVTVMSTSNMRCLHQMLDCIQKKIFTIQKNIYYSENTYYKVYQKPIIEHSFTPYRGLKLNGSLANPNFHLYWHILAKLSTLCSFCKLIF